MEIDAKPTDLKRLFVGRDIAFKVPPYQRNYSWSADIEDWIYSIGNMTLLIGKKNASVGNKSFSEKVEKYKQASSETPDGTRISMTYQIHQDFVAGESEWTAERITKRAQKIASNAPQIWPL